MLDLLIPCYPSIDTRFVLRRWKQVSQPMIVYNPNLLDHAGIYIAPTYSVEHICDSELFNDAGIIQISTAKNMEPLLIESTIAHELRHHWQHSRGWQYDGIGWPVMRSGVELDYQDAVIQYFTRSRSEMDALRFELWRSKDDCIRSWWDFVEPTMIEH